MFYDYLYIYPKVVRMMRKRAAPCPGCVAATRVQKYMLVPALRLLR